ncbi:MAG: class I SAM-dependent methyltransferase [Gammaproteobacteria bacterium]|nr:class I SAM-dependent methyltransferase [Gammaproteobacteria bacterium]MCP5299889.1 class I SAM-dependent methyltransferase [Chromatiaceae bacterium]
MKCPICTSQDLRHVQDLCDDRYGFPESYPLVACRVCGHRFLGAAFTPAELTRLYTDYYPRGGQVDVPQQPSRERGRLAAWWQGDAGSASRWVPAGSRVLDVGCGACQSLDFLRRRGCEVHGVEADENVREIARAGGFDVRIGPFDPADFEPGSFDCITMDQVIEHMPDPVQTLRGVAQLLRPGGVAVLSTPNAEGWGAALFGRRWINWHSPYHLHHFSRSSLHRLAEPAGLMIERIAHITNADWLLYQWIHLATVPACGTASSFWSTKSARSSRERVAIRAVSVLHATGFDHLLTRLFDALGIGDNRIILLRRPT